MSNSDPGLLLPLVNNLLRHSPLAHEEQEAVLTLPISVRTAKRTEYIARQDEAAPDCMIILDGFACCSKVAGDGGRQILSFHMRSDMVNLHSALLDRADYSVQALTAVRGAYIRSSALTKIATAHPGIASAFWRGAAIDSCIATEWMLNVGRRNARRRVAHLICELVLRQQILEICKGPVYHWPLTQIEVADASGLTNIHVGRVLQGLQREHLVLIDRPKITILDWRTLSDVADFDKAYLHQSQYDVHLKAINGRYN